MKCPNPAVRRARPRSAAALRALPRSRLPLREGGHRWGRAASPSAGAELTEKRLAPALSPGRPARAAPASRPAARAAGIRR